ncbi:SOS response-associated peptidase [Nocardiopsis sp. CNT-189]|uniref:SOS response-associated peptidase n=1 Tax=Nocardiopsis oceanisediminis TaxID=2816862 RepID=UPI003B38F92F
MCGRFAQARNLHDLQLAFDIPGAAPGPAGGGPAMPPLEELEPDYNISPGKSVQAVLGTPPGRRGPDAPRGPQGVGTFRWGLIPSWAKDAAVGYKMINARSETVADKPAFRDALRRRRCLLPATAYYEWQYLPDAAPGTAEAGTSPATDPAHRRRKAKSRKRPFSVGYPDGSPLALAGLFERWRDPALPDDHPAAWVWSCTVVTTEARGGLAGIHERMPVVLPPEEWDAWLDPASGWDAVRGAMDATPVGGLELREVSTAVNSIKNNGPALLDPPDPAEAAAAEPATLF